MSLFKEKFCETLFIFVDCSKLHICIKNNNISNWMIETQLIRKKFSFKTCSNLYFYMDDKSDSQTLDTKALTLRYFQCLPYTHIPVKMSRVNCLAVFFYLLIFIKRNISLRSLSLGSRVILSSPTWYDIKTKNSAI